MLLDFAMKPKTTNLQDIFQLGSIGSQQSNIQHALANRLLSGVPVYIQAALGYFKFSQACHNDLRRKKNEKLI